MKHIIGPIACVPNGIQLYVRSVAYQYTCRYNTFHAKLHMLSSSYYECSTSMDIMVWLRDKHGIIGGNVCIVCTNDSIRDHRWGYFGTRKRINKQRVKQDWSVRHGWIVISLLQPQPEGEIVLISLSTNGVNALSFYPTITITIIIILWVILLDTSPSFAQHHQQQQLLLRIPPLTRSPPFLPHSSCVPHRHYL